MPRTVWISFCRCRRRQPAPTADIAIDDVGIAVEVHVPDLRGDQRLGQHLARCAASSSSSRANSLAVRSIRLPWRCTRQRWKSSSRSASCRVVLLQLLAAPAQQGAHLGEQFDEGERLLRRRRRALFEAAPRPLRHRGQSGTAPVQSSRPPCLRAGSTPAPSRPGGMTSRISRS